LPLTLKGWISDVERFPLPNLILNHPLDKIFGDMPARLTDFTQASVRHYSRRLHLNVMATISGFVSRRIGGPQVPAPLDVYTKRSPNQFSP
jgi:hypothetical protein